MKKLLAIAIGVICMLNMAVATPVLASTEIHVYPGDSIQAAVDAASPGGTIIVHKGEYHQSVVITTGSITLKGIGKIILDGTAPADAGTTLSLIGIMLSDGASGVTITGFEIRGFGLAVHLSYGSQGNEVLNNEIADSSFIGIMASGSSGNLIKNNIITNSNISALGVGGMGVVLEQHSHKNKVINNKITDSVTAGIYVDENSTGNLIEKNKVSNSGAAGIVIDDSHDNDVIENNVTDSAQWGIVLVRTASGNLIKKNKVFDSGEFDLFEADLSGIGNVWENNRYDTSGTGVWPLPY